MTDPNWNPFADDSNDEKDIIVTDVTEVSPLEISVTIKQASTTGAPWFIAKGTADQINAYLADKATIKATLDGINDANQYFGGLLPDVATPAPAAGGGAAKPAYQQAPTGETRHCKHGEMQFRSGSKNGRVWKAFMCPTPQGTEDQCAPQFLK